MNSAFSKMASRKMIDDFIVNAKCNAKCDSDHQMSSDCLETCMVVLQQDCVQTTRALETLGVYSDSHVVVGSSVPMW